MSQTSQNVRAVVTQFERHMDLGSVSVHFYVQHPTCDVGKSMAALVALNDTDDNIAKKAWDIVAPKAFVWISTTSAPITGREFVVPFQPPPPEIIVDQSSVTTFPVDSPVQDGVDQSTVSIPVVETTVQDISVVGSTTNNM